VAYKFDNNIKYYLDGKRISHVEFRRLAEDIGCVSYDPSGIGNDTSFARMR
jgi:hypothetical protein